MQPYAAVAPLTVISTGTPAAGQILTSGATDPHGWWPVPLVVVGNDARSSTNLPAAVQAATDRTNWLGWRTLDIWGGGNYLAARGTVQIGGLWEWQPATGAQAIVASGTSASNPLVGFVQNGTGDALDVVQNGAGAVATLTAGAAVAAAAAVIVDASASTVTAISGIGGGTNPGLLGTAGTVSGSPAIRSKNGPVQLLGTGAVAAPSTPISNAVYGNSFDKFAVNATGATINGTSLNVASVAIGTDTTTGHPAIKVTFVTPMADNYYQLNAPCAVGSTAKGYPSTMTQTSFYVVFTINTPSVDTILDATALGSLTYCLRGGGTQ